MTTPDAVPQAGARLRAWLAAGQHGDMHWMAATADRRAEPRRLWPEVGSVIMLGMNYGPEVDPLAVLQRREAGAISVYARHRDYHDVVKGKLKQLAAVLDGAEAKVFVDTAPIMEKPLAAAAGIGWMGKHTNLVSTDYGSWLFLGSIFTTLALEPDPPAEARCGSCRACLDVCPTGAFPAPYRLDATRCISYLTIEHKGHIDRALRPMIGNRIYGCDDCLAVCPWNKFAVTARDAKLTARPDLDGPSLDRLAGLDDGQFRAMFAGGPIKRIGIDRFLRNVLVAIGNSGIPQLAGRAAELACHPSPLVRAAAIWAGVRLLGRGAFAARVPPAAWQDSDPDVRSEWELP